MFVIFFYSIGLIDISHRDYFILFLMYVELSAVSILHTVCLVF